MLAWMLESAGVSLQPKGLNQHQKDVTNYAFKGDRDAQVDQDSQLKFNQIMTDLHLR